jgi:hypothetical protein
MLTALQGARIADPGEDAYAGLKGRSVAQAALRRLAILL